MRSPIVILLTFALAIGVLSNAEQDLGEYSLRLAIEARNAYLLEQVSAYHISKHVAEQRKLQEDEDVDGDDNEDADSIDDEEEEIDGDDSNDDEEEEIHDEDDDNNDDDEEEEIHDEEVDKEPLRRQLRLRK